MAPAESLVRATPPLQGLKAETDLDVGVPAAAINPRNWAVQRSLTLLWVFLLASAVILLAGAVLLSGLLSSRLRGQVIGDARTSLTQYVDGVLRPELVDRNNVVVRRGLPQRQVEALGRRPDVVTNKGCRANRVLPRTNRSRGRISTHLRRHRN